MSSRIPGLSAIAPNYKGILSDIWGVLHNGVEYFDGAVEALSGFRAAGGSVVLITNAPRPSASIKEQLDRLQVPRAAYDDVVTSGDVTRDALIASGKTRVYHLGPDRDRPLFEGLGVSLVSADDAEIICCTGLIDDRTETPDDYDDVLKSLAKRDLPFICANPDRVADKGGRMLFCAGALADRYAAYGGEPLMMGKPEAPIYEGAIKALNAAHGSPMDKSDMLIIGDAFATDIRGGHYQKIDCLFITSGIHYEMFGPQDDPDDERVNLRLTHEDLETVGYMPRLGW